MMQIPMQHYITLLALLLEFAVVVTQFYPRVDNLLLPQPSAECDACY